MYGIGARPDDTKSCKVQGWLRIVISSWSIVLRELFPLNSCLLLVHQPCLEVATKKKRKGVAHERQQQGKYISSLSRPSSSVFHLSKWSHNCLFNDVRWWLNRKTLNIFGVYSVHCRAFAAIAYTYYIMPIRLEHSDWLVPVLWICLCRLLSKCRSNNPNKIIFLLSSYQDTNRNEHRAPGYWSARCLRHSIRFVDRTSKWPANVTIE